MNTQTTDLEKLATMIKDIKFTMLSTVAPDGSIHSRPMATQSIDSKNFDGTLWFFSKKDSFKNADIQSDQHVNLAYANPDKQQYVSVSGRATVTQDKTKMQELWNPIYKAWFPEGLNDPEISLIGVNVESAELWDSPPSKVVQMAGFVKAAVTGQPYDQKSHSEHINVDTRH